jgi:hypothetical protein
MVGRILVKASEILLKTGIRKLIDEYLPTILSNTVVGSKIIVDWWGNPAGQLKECYRPSQ